MNNENESQAVILKSHELMAEYVIDAIISDDQPITYSKEFCVHPGNRKFRKISQA